MILLFEVALSFRADIREKYQLFNFQAANCSSEIVHVFGGANIQYIYVTTR
jgi:hypothetical protein